MKSTLTGIAFICCLAPLPSCSTAQCQPGNYDGAWEVVGKSPPSINAIKSSLVGMTGAVADDFMNEKAKIVPGDAQQHVEWIFESRKKLIMKDCHGPDIITHRQDVLVVEAVLDGGIVQSCSIRIRGSISNRVRSVEEIVSSNPGPLDGLSEDCVRR